MAKTLFFYDTETSGTNPAYQRIMQFGGQRTSLDLKPIGDPINWLVKLSEDVLPEPEAILVHGISPQRTITEGINEAEFAKRLSEEIFTPDTVAIGFNNIRFDDEFMRNTLWRNFYDPYEWHWADGRSRWDLLDATRMMRALRPGGVNWPMTEDGRPTNAMGGLAIANGIDQGNAHDALSDVKTTISLAQLVRSAQPKMFGYLFGMREKKIVEQLISQGSPFVYTSGRFGGDNLFTTVVQVVASHPSENGSVLVYDLRVDPKPYIDLPVDELARRIYIPYSERDKTPQLPVKKLALNKTPAVAPLGVLDQESQVRLGLEEKTIDKHLLALNKAEDFKDRVKEAFASQKFPKRVDADGQLYDMLPKKEDKLLLAQVRQANLNDLADLNPPFTDERLGPLLLRYKARNFPETLTDKEQVAWESWRQHKLLKGVDSSLTLAEFGRRLGERAATPGLSDQQKFLLEEVKLWGESIAPASLF